MEEKDYFRESFKYFKQKNDPDVLHAVTNIETLTVNKTAGPLNQVEADIPNLNCSLCTELGLLCHTTWDIYSVRDLNGFFFIKNPFSVEGQQHWMRKCLVEYPRKPSVTNLDLHYKDVDDVWSSHTLTKVPYIEKLCWTTLGYHYNWDTKEYNPNHYSCFPECLASLSKHIAFCLGFETFRPEAAIVNYYSTKSSLGIHNDHSEEALDQPILSFSFGQTAIFLVGTSIKTDHPTALFLKSGDIVVLSGASRLSYHAVPAIIKEPIDNIVSHCKELWKPYHQYLSEHRINISVRQVYQQNVT